MSEVTFKGTPVSLSGNEIKVGDKAPIIELVGKDLSKIKVGGAKEKVQILVTVPSIDTGVCATQTRKFNQNAGKNELVELTIISMDLPFAFGRFCGAEGIENIRVASDFDGRKFGQNYGVVLKDCPLEGLLARTIFVVDKNGVVAYKQIVPEITTEPDYEAIQEAVKKLGACNCECSM